MRTGYERKGIRTSVRYRSPVSAVIEITDLTVRFGDVTAVAGLNLSVESGEIFGFLGPNGAGKTTTIRTLVDLLRPTSGNVRVLGRDVRGGAAEQRAAIGFLPGDLALFPGLTGRETLAFFARLQRRPPRSREAVLDRLGLADEALGRKVSTYSTGMRQKIGITIAFQHDPQLLILDEPTSGLDPFVREAFLGLVREAPKRGATVFLSSHVLAEVESCADRIALVDGGELRLLESIDAMRRDRPRHVILRYADGREERRTHAGDPAALLATIDTTRLIDVEIRPAGLEDTVKAALQHGSER